MKKEYLIYKLSEEMKEATRIDNELFPKFDVKRGLRHSRELGFDFPAPISTTEPSNSTASDALSWPPQAFSCTGCTDIHAGKTLIKK